MWGRTSQAKLFLTQVTPTPIILEGGGVGVRVSAQQARVKSKEGEAKFPVEITV